MDGFGQQIIEGKNMGFSTNKVRGMASAYAPAFIQVADANQAGWNTSRTIPFFKNKDVFDFLFTGVFDSAKNVFDSSTFWAHTVTIGYQPDFSEDRDNNNENPLLGVTPENPLTDAAFGYSAIYDETIRDYAYEIFRADQYQPSIYPNIERYYYGLLFGIIAHETGHAPGKRGEGDDHAEKGLMKQYGDQIAVDFSPQSIKRFRTSKSWTQGTP
jgi:hypothetical protein